ncbi:MAG: hypothetical protein KAS99_01870, partial [Candidatus Omnitrophica bacterium]|nr:hypothetical protein [Candidatus Omnitrophota bacterium]
FKRIFPVNISSSFNKYINRRLKWAWKLQRLHGQKDIIDFEAIYLYLLRSNLLIYSRYVLMLFSFLNKLHRWFFLQ